MKRQELFGVDPGSNGQYESFEIGRSNDSPYFVVRLSLAAFALRHLHEQRKGRRRRPFEVKPCQLQRLPSWESCCHPRRYRYGKPDFARERLYIRWEKESTAQALVRESLVDADSQESIHLHAYCSRQRGLTYLTIRRRGLVPKVRREVMQTLDKVRLGDSILSSPVTRRYRLLASMAAAASATTTTCCAVRRQWVVSSSRQRGSRFQRATEFGRRVAVRRGKGCQDKRAMGRCRRRRWNVTKDTGCLTRVAKEGYIRGRSCPIRTEVDGGRRRRSCRFWPFGSRFPSFMAHSCGRCQRKSSRE